MKKYLILTAFILILPTTTTFAQNQNCGELRRACEMKNSLGEVGQGNCRTYRQRCGADRVRPNCRQLRAACMYKNETGEVGQGNCQRYREACQ